YRKRFAIETSFRQAHQGRARTCTRNPVVRLLLVGVALVLRNVWVWLHYAVLSTPRRGNRRYNLDRLTLRAMLLWLQHQAEDELGRRDDAPSERPVAPQATVEVGLTIANRWPGRNLGSLRRLACPCPGSWWPFTASKPDPRPAPRLPGVLPMVAATETG